MGDFERGWVVTKRIKYGHCAKLIGMKTDKISIISTTIKLNKARTKREELQDLVCKDKNALWGEEDGIFDLGLKKFRVYISAINETPTSPERIFRCCLEYWEKPLITPNRAA